MIRLAILIPLMLLAPCGGAANAAREGADAAAPGQAEMVGRYRLRGQPDEVVRLELLPDGRFRYMMIAGAVDAHAEGRWTGDGGIVTLNTEPRPRPSEFATGPVSRDDAHPLTILVNAPNGRGIASIDLRVGFADGSVIEGYTQEDGWQPYEGQGTGTPQWVELSLAMYGIAPRRFPLDAAAGNVFAFTFIPNDLGVVDFRDQELAVNGRDLIAIGDGGSAIFVREE